MSLLPPDHEPATMSFGDHLEELRRRVILALLPPLPLAIIAFFFSERLIELLLEPHFRVLAAHNLPQQVQALYPPEMLLAQLKLSVIFALIASAPWILWQAWRFISPGLFAHERRFVYFLIPGSAILTVAAASLLYFVMLPLLLHVMIMFGGGMRTPATVLPAPDAEQIASPAEAFSSLDVVTADPSSPHPGQAWIKMPERVMRIAVLVPEAARDGPAVLEFLELPLGPRSRLVQHYRVSEYISFVLLLLLGMVVAFQMPLVIVLMGWLGLASPQWLAKQRRYALLICAVVAAMTTPAEVVSMLVMLIPLYGLYELGILLLRIAPASAVAEGRFRYRSTFRDDKDE